MALIEIFRNFLNKNIDLRYFQKLQKLKAFNTNTVIFFSFIIFSSILFFIAISSSQQKKLINESNLKEVTGSSEFSKFTKYLISKINSPYEEITYVIQINDSIEKILDKYNVNKENIKIITTKLKQKKLSNIYSGRKISLILKKLPNSENEIVNLLFPINNTTSVEVRKYQDNFIVKENILKLEKKN